MIPGAAAAEAHNECCHFICKIDFGQIGVQLNNIQSPRLARFGIIVALFAEATIKICMNMMTVKLNGTTLQYFDCAVMGAKNTICLYQLYVVFWVLCSSRTFSAAGT